MTTENNKSNYSLSFSDNYSNKSENQKNLFDIPIEFFDNNPLKWENILISKEMLLNIPDIKPMNNYHVVDIHTPQYGMSIPELYECLLDAINKQHEKTRSVVKEESAEIKRELIACIKNNPIDAVDFFSKIILIFASFSLCVWGIIGFAIINPLFSITLIICSISTILMAKIKRSKIN